MTSEVLALLLRVNLAASVVIVAVLVLRLPLRRLIGAQLAYGLWCAVPLAALASLLPARVVTARVLPALPLQAASQAAVDWVLPPPLAPIATRSLVDGPDIALFVWAVVAVAAMALVAWLQGRSVSRLGGLSRQTGTQRLYKAGNSGFGPAVIGALWPRIVVPADFADRFNARERAVVLAHETVHLARSDARINALVVLMQCLNWFNPIVHVAAYLVRIDQELACDAAVMARYPEARRSYAEAMLKTQLAAAPLPLGCYWPARSENPLKEKLAMLKLKAPGPVRRLFGATSIVALTLAAGYAAWSATPAVAQAPVNPAGAVSAALAPPGQPTVGKLVTPPAVISGQGGAAATTAAPPSTADASPADAPAFVSIPELADKARAATYDGTSPVLLKATLDTVQYGDGGAVLVVTADGKTWGLLGGSPDTLAANGLSPAQLTPGTQFIVRGYQAIDKSCATGCIGLGRDITFLDGTKYDLVKDLGNGGLVAALTPAGR